MRHRFHNKVASCRPFANLSPAMAIGLAYGVIALGVGFTILGIVIAGVGYALEPQIFERYGLQLQHKNKVH